MRLFAGGQRGERKAAEGLYAAAVTAARQPTLYVDYGVPDSLEGRFEMVALHLFALIHRLMHDPGDDPALARLIAETFVNDMDGSLREMGVGDMTVPRRMKALYGSFAGRLAAYEAALKHGEAAVTAAIARNVFPDSPEDARAKELSKYLGATAEALRRAEIGELQHGNVVFPEPSPQGHEVRA
jgi:cytochrome b pre-mRNA-processing protein 3